ncbi:Eukaryotic translation initiation factor 3 subunit B, partial [Dichanthelium oligosanthes]
VMMMRYSIMKTLLRSKWVCNTIVVDNLPGVLPEKFEKLGNSIQKIFSRAYVIKEGKPCANSWKRGAVAEKSFLVSVIARCTGRTMENILLSRLIGTPKIKKSTYTGFDLFRIKERDIPVEVLELDNKNDKIIAFAWEPKGHRFAIIHGDGPNPDISFYSMRTAKSTTRVSKLTTLKSKEANALYWCPTGAFHSHFWAEGLWWQSGVLQC